MSNALVLSRKRRIASGSLAFFCSLITITAARAHDPGLSIALVELHRHQVRVSVTFSPGDLVALGSTKDPSALKKLATRAVEWRVDGKSAIPIHVAVTANETTIAMEAIFSPSAGEFRAALLPELPFGHRQLLTIRQADGDLVVSKLLSATQISEPISAAAWGDTPPSAEPAGSSFASFFRLGIEHIALGFDHLCFLGGLLLTCTRLRPAVQIITSFTVAHSLTLAAVTFSWFELRGRFVEPMIAASIVYVGLENILRKGETRWREAVTFIFGLIHGMGFAGVLRELGVGVDRAGVAMPLVAFNLGVECGQLAIAAALLPLLWRLRRSAHYQSRWLPGISALLALAGAIWFVQRISFLK